MKLVEVFIPAYNAENFLEETLDSVLSQDYAKIKITVVDNCSTDNTWQIATGYEKFGVSYIKNSSNIGSFPNHLRCADMAAGDYLKLLSSDDVLLPYIVSAQVDALESHHGAGLATCNAIETDHSLTPRREVIYLNGYSKGHEVIRYAASTGENRIGGPSNWMLRVSTIRKMAYSYNGLKWLADLDYVCNILQISDLINVDRFGFYYRRHDNADSYIGCPMLTRSREQILFAKRWESPMPALLKARLRHLRNIIMTSRLIRTSSA